MTNSKAILYFIYNNINIENLFVKNISCSGEGGASSFLFFNSGEEEKKLIIKNMKVMNSKSNGPFIKINGFSNEFLMENATITDIISYGSIIDNSSFKVNLKNLTIF